MLQMKLSALPLPCYRMCPMDAMSNTTLLNTVHFCCTFQAGDF